MKIVLFDRIILPSGGYTEIDQIWNKGDLF